MTRPPRPTAVLLALVASAVTGCSGPGPDPRPATASAPATSTPVPATTTPDPAAVAGVCDTVDTLVTSYLLDEAFAVTAEPAEGPAYRGRIAEIRQNLALRLLDLGLEAGGELGAALVGWSAANSEVARFVAENEPGPGNVVEYGPAQQRANAAQATVESLCGRSIP